MDPARIVDRSLALPISTDSLDERGTSTQHHLATPRTEPCDEPLPQPISLPATEKMYEIGITTVSSTSGSLASTGDAKANRPRHATWRPSALHIAPLIGLAALLLAFLQMFASYAVLQASDGAETRTWKYQPTVVRHQTPLLERRLTRSQYLAIFVAVSNKALAFAAIQGTVISWWLQALRGSNVKQLHADWSYGLHVWQAMVAGRHFNALALACICATFVGASILTASHLHAVKFLMVYRLTIAQ